MTSKDFKSIIPADFTIVSNYTPKDDDFLGYKKIDIANNTKINNPVLTLSCFANIMDVKPVLLTTHWLTYVDFIKQGHRILDTDKNNAGHIKFVKFNNYRDTDHAEFMSALILDYDDGMSLEDAKELFKEYEFVLYTSYNHQTYKYNDDGTIKDTPKDKFRIIFPFKAQCLKEKWEKIRKHVLTFAPGVDPVSRVITQIYSENFVSTENQFKAVWFYNAGKLLDWHTWPEEKKVFDNDNKKNQTVIYTDAERDELLTLLKNINLNYEQWWKMVSAMITAGYDLHDLVAVSFGNANHDHSKRDNKNIADLKTRWQSFEKRNMNGKGISTGYLWNLVGGKPKDINLKEKLDTIRHEEENLEKIINELERSLKSKKK